MSTKSKKLWYFLAIGYVGSSRSYFKQRGPFDSEDQANIIAKEFKDLSGYSTTSSWSV
jgi:hypothetical protein